MKRILPLLLSLLLLTGCASNQPGQYPDGVPSSLTAVRWPEAPHAEDYDAQRSLRADVTPEQLESLNRFAVNSAKVILGNRSQTENCLYSPVSLYFALSMLASITGGDTQAQILSALASDEAMLEHTGALYRFLYRDDEYTRLFLANSAWMEKSVAETCNQDALTDLAQIHYAELFPVDFQDAAAGEAMGQWVSQNTNGLLGEALQVSPETLLSLLNTVYFRSEWMSAFQESATAPGVFHNGDGTESQCDFMNKTMDGSFFRNDVFTAASLSLKSGAVTFLLPGEGLRPSDVLASPSWEALVKDQLESTGYGEVVLKVPKLDYSDSLDLLDAAKALGIQAAFDPMAADFSPLCSDPLFVSAIRQESALTMDEKGVEAASYTQIDVAGASMPTDQAELILDRPFLFVIRAEGAAPLFVGIVNTMAQ